jgi:multidrug efflux pump subunit AcrA (membrane-fusion protein)
MPAPAREDKRGSKNTQKSRLQHTHEKRRLLMKVLKFRNFLSAHKRGVRIAIIAVALALSAGLVWFFFLRSGQSAQQENALAYARTMKLERGTLANTVSAKGVVQSGSVSSVAPALESKIIGVNVKVGDKVKKGDVIAVQDTGDIDKEIADKRTAMTEEQQGLNAGYQQSASQVGEAKATKSRLAQEHDSYVNAAAAARSRAKGELDAARAVLGNAQNSYRNAVNSVSAAQSAYDAAQVELRRVYEAWIAAGGIPDDSNPQKAAYNAAMATAEEKRNNLEQAKVIYGFDQSLSAYEAAKADSDSKVAALETAQSAYDASVQTKQNVLNDQDRVISELNSQLKTAEQTKKKGVSARELNELLKRKESAVLRAETDGEVTDLKAVVGSVPKDTIATIQSTDKLTLAIRISEHDINKVTVGLPAIIKSEATATPIKGFLSRISPTADSVEGSTGFSADITIEGGKGLRIGGKGKAEIILSSKENILLAPIDAVGTNASGQSYLVAMKKGVPEEVIVTTGDKNDYLIEVSGKGISEGMEILANADWAGLLKEAKKNAKNEDEMAAQANEI